MRSKRILIVRPDRIGDAVLSTPIPRALKESNKNNFVAVLVRKYTKDIFLNNPFIDQIISLDDGKSFFQKVNEIRTHQFTHSFNLLPTSRTNYLLFFSGIKYRIGVGHKFYQFITNTKSVYRRKYKPLRSEADYCFDMVRKIGIDKKDLKTEIFLSSEELEKVKIRKRELNPYNKILIGLHVGSGNSAPNWDAKQYFDLFTELKSQQNIKVVITDNFPIAEFDSSIQPNLNLSLRQSFINFASLDYLVSASTGPMHIAAALGVKTISLFCPLTACSPVLWGPVGNTSYNLLPESDYCKNKCPGNPKLCSFEGSKKLSASSVFEEIRSIINQ